MSIAAKRKGSGWERDVVGVFRDRGFSQAQRALAGATDDMGDVAGVPGVCVEAKNCKRIELGAWMAEVELEATNAGVLIPVLAIKRRLKPAEQGYAVTTLGVFADLIARRTA